MRTEGKDLWQKTRFRSGAIPRLLRISLTKSFYHCHFLTFYHLINFIVKIQKLLFSTLNLNHWELLHRLNPKRPVLVIHNSRIGLLQISYKTPWLDVESLNTYHFHPLAFSKATQSLPWNPPAKGEKSSTQRPVYLDVAPSLWLQKLRLFLIQ